MPQEKLAAVWKECRGNPIFPGWYSEDGYHRKFSSFRHADRRYKKVKKGMERLGTTRYKSGLGYPLSPPGVVEVRDLPPSGDFQVEEL